MRFSIVVLATLVLTSCKAPDQASYFGPGSSDCAGVFTVNLTMTTTPPAKVKVVFSSLGISFDECDGDIDFERTPPRILSFGIQDTGFTPPERVSFQLYDQNACSGTSTLIYSVTNQLVASPAPARCSDIAIDLTQ